MAAMARLAAAVAVADAAAPPVEVGGVVAAVCEGEVRVAGLANHAACGERVRLDQPFGEGAAAGEIVRVGPDGAVVRPYGNGAALRLGTPVFLSGPLVLHPSVRWLGRVIGGTGAPLDGGPTPPPDGPPRRIDGPPPPPFTRGTPGGAIRTGVKVIDLFTPLVHGQRIGVFAGAGVGKSTVLAMLARAPGFDAVVAVLVGERAREARGFLEGPLAPDPARAVLVVATADESPMVRRQAPLVGMTVAEALADDGGRVLLILDSLTRYAHAQREVALAAGEPPVARGYPPSVFAAIPRLMERAGPRLAGGSITAVASVLVDGDDHDDPVADAARGVLDGHIVLDRTIAEGGRLPAVDIPASLSRLADAAWTAEQRTLVARLRALIHAYEDSRDLRLLSGDAAVGSDGDLAQAVAVVPRVYKALAQRPDDPPSRDVYADLAKLMRQA